MRKALVVDDEPAIRFALKRWFERKGWAVAEADDGRTALALIEAEQPVDSASFDVIVCDLHMPGVSGDQLRARLAEIRPELLERLIFTTGDDVAGLTANSGLGERRHILQKPFEFSALREAVESITGSM